MPDNTIQSTELEKDIYEIKLPRTFDFESHGNFRTAVKESMAKNPRELKLNFEDVKYLDSSALGMLMLAKHEGDAAGCAVKITNLQDGHAKKVLELVKFDKLFHIESA